MTYIICEPCVGTCDTACVDVCPVDCIHGPFDKKGSGEEAQTMLGMELNRPMLDGTRAGGNGNWE